MLTLRLDDFHVELKDGSVKNVGAPTKSATVKLYDIDTVDVAAFGDERVKLSGADEEGNAVELALFPEQASAVAREIDSLAEESSLFD